MQILNVKQGTQEWRKARLERFTASEAPAMMGVSKYQSRDELLTQKKTGIAPEINEHTQKIFDRGHAAEASCRELIEAEHGELFPVVLVEGDYLASLDGQTIEGDTVWEHKLWNKELAQQVADCKLEPHYYWQLEHQLMVSGADHVIFTCSDGTANNKVSMMYKPVEGRREQLIAGWEQFKKDLAEFEVKEQKPKAVAAPIESLPAIVYELNGLALNSNLAIYKEKALALVEQSKLPLTSDQDFADRAELCKKFREAEKKIKLVSEQVISEISDIAEFRDNLSFIGEQIRQARLAGEKAVKNEKQRIKNGLTEDGGKKAAEYKASLKFGELMQHINADFVSATHGLKTLSSMESAINDELARFKIQANEAHSKMLENDSLLNEQSEYEFLFADKNNLLCLNSDHLKAEIQNRINAHIEREKLKNETANRAEEQASTEETEAENKPSVQAGASAHTANEITRKSIIQLVANSFGLSEVAAENRIKEVFCK